MITIYVGSAYPGGQQSAPPYIAPPGGQAYPAGPSGPVRSNSSPHTPYQPVYPGIVIIFSSMAVLNL